MFQIYFSGCAGDITMGKYNAGGGDPRSGGAGPRAEDRAALADRLHDAMVRSVNRVAREPRPEGTRPLEWRTVPVQFPLRSDPAFSEETNRAVLREAEAGEPRFGAQRQRRGPGPGARARVKAALTLAFIERVQAGRSVSSAYGANQYL